LMATALRRTCESSSLLERINREGCATSDGKRRHNRLWVECDIDPTGTGDAPEALSRGVLDPELIEEACGRSVRVQGSGSVGA